MKKKLKCVLLVDDNESDNYIHKRVLEKSGIAESVEITMNGKEALDFLTENGGCGKPPGSYCQPELIFLDINMPIMDGWEFLEEYRKLEDSQKGKIVFIMLTTSLNPVDKTKAEKLLENGCFYFKPLTLQMIRDIMQQRFPDYL
jgi:CheY-like chemotaxis protein